MQQVIHGALGVMRAKVLGRALLVVLACVLNPLDAVAVNLTFLGNSPVSFFQPDDVNMMRKNAQEVLDSPQPNAKRTWSNPKTGASGFAEVTGKFTTADGTLCKRLRIFNKAGGVEGESTYPVCKYPDRGWVINADARPAS
jgi:hypothetical protein